MISVDIPTFRRLYLHDLDLENQHGEPLSDDDVRAFLRNAVADFQREFGVRLTPTIVRLGYRPIKSEPPTRHTPPEGATPEEAGALPPLEEFDALTYDPRSFEGNRHARLQLPVGPVKRVYGVGLELPGRDDLVEFPSDSVQVITKRKTLQIYWKKGFAYAPVFALSGLGVIALTGGRSIPNAWHVAYLAGYTQADLDGNDADVLEAVQKMAAIRALVLGSADRNFAAGITGRTVSVDDLAQTTNLVASAEALKYGSLIKAYREDLDAFKRTYAHRKSGVKLAVL